MVSLIEGRLPERDVGDHEVGGVIGEPGAGCLLWPDPTEPKRCPLESSALRPKAQLAPRAAVDDADAVDYLIERDSTVVKLGFVEEKVLCGSVCEEQAKGLVIGEQIEAQLRGALATQITLGAGALALGDGPDAVEGAALRLAVMISGAGAAEAEDARLEYLLRLGLIGSHEALESQIV